MLQLRPATKFMDSLFTSGMVLRDAAAAPVPHTFTHTSDSHVLPTTYLLVATAARALAPSATYCRKDKVWHKFTFN